MYWWLVRAGVWSSISAYFVTWEIRVSSHQWSHTRGGSFCQHVPWCGRGLTPTIQIPFRNSYPSLSLFHSLSLTPVYILFYVSSSCVKLYLTHPPSLYTFGSLRLSEISLIVNAFVWMSIFRVPPAFSPSLSHSDKQWRGLASPLKSRTLLSIGHIHDDIDRYLHWRRTFYLIQKEEVFSLYSKRKQTLQENMYFLGYVFNYVWRKR